VIQKGPALGPGRAWCHDRGLVPPPWSLQMA